MFNFRIFVQQILKLNIELYGIINVQLILQIKMYY